MLTNLVHKTNVVVNGLGQAQLTDYGFAIINSGIRFIPNESTAGNVRWLAPEIIRASSGLSVESKPADIFAFAMLAIETFTEKKPFDGESDPRVVGRIFQGDRPRFPQNAIDVGFTTQMYRFLQKCWDSDPEKRPAIAEVETTWEGLVENDECVSRTANRNRSFLYAYHSF